ncbi:hypothetical protein EDD18DRAFT_23332 [Armillaria luteobubalina]|uniref:Uncharacterized protein n=1 Tax=Armillaria luteobubalina TaxID=153913 RepID=A0AA39QNI5_9AGAR|nr:hypothetical protein EDD18DRAFT_23332 [Armillaria luteobubalina]
MVSMLSESSLQSLEVPHLLEDSPEPRFEVPLNELGNLHDAVEPFTKAIMRSGNASVRLHCTVPTWCPSSDICLDLHDLHDLRSRCLLFIHDLLQALRSSGVHASYSLAPSNSSLCLVCASPPDLKGSQVTSFLVDILQHTKLSKRENVILADLKSCPSLIIT